MAENRTDEPPAPGHEPEKVITLTPEVRAKAERQRRRKAGDSGGGGDRGRRGGGGGGRRGGPPDGADNQAEPPFPADCPVRVLGTNAAGVHACTASGAYVLLEPRNVSQTGIRALFLGEAVQAWLTERYPRPVGRGIDFARVAWAVWNTGALNQNFDPSARLRGVGFWRDGDTLVLNAGNALHLWPSGGSPLVTQLGELGGMIYLSGPPQPLPAPELVEDSVVDFLSGMWEGPAGEVMNALKRWNLRRGDFDRMLLLGVIGCGIAGGALDWRPHAWLTGIPGTGKSSLARTIFHLQGAAGAVIHTIDATAAGIRQNLQQSSRPVVCDEMEATWMGAKEQGVILLMRGGSSGGEGLRGGADHKAQQFKITSSFINASVNHPPFDPQDYSRIVVLELNKPARTDGAVFDPYAPAWLLRMEALGRDLRARWVQGQARWPDVRQTFCAAVARLVDERAADTWGQSIAMAWLMLYDNPPETSDVEEWVNAMAGPIAEQRGESGQDHEQLIGTLMTSMVPVDRGQAPIGDLLAAWAAWETTPLEGGGAGAADSYADTQLGRRVLRAHGLTLVRARNGGGDLVAFAVRHTQLEKLLAGTRWARAGWTQSLKRIEGWEKRSVKFGARVAEAILVPIAAVLGERESGA